MFRYRYFESVAARIVRPAVLTVANTVTIAIAIGAIRNSIMVTVPVPISVPVRHATVIGRNHIANAAGQETANGDQHYCKRLHIFSWEK